MAIPANAIRITATALMFGLAKRAGVEVCRMVLTRDADSFDEEMT